jgi:hypothetical protein
VRGSAPSSFPAVACEELERLLADARFWCWLADHGHEHGEPMPEPLAARARWCRDVLEVLSERRDGEG